MSSASNRAGASTKARLCGTMAVLALLLPFVPNLAQAENAAAERFSILRTWQPTTLPPGMSAEAYIDEAHPLVAPASRRLYVLGRSSWLAAYDLDSLEPLGAGAAVYKAQTSLYAARWTTAYVDPVSEELRIAVLDADGSVHLDSYVSTPAGVVRRSSVPLPGMNGKEVRVMYRDPGRDVLWMAASDSLPIAASSVPRVVVGEVGLRPGDGEHWTQLVDDCRGLIMAERPLSPTAFGFVNNSLYFGCRNFHVTGNTRVPLPGGVGRLPVAWSPDGSRTSPGPFHLYARDGDFTGNGGDLPSVFDPRSGRVALGARAFTVDVFDTRMDAYIGTVGIGANVPNIFGVDGSTGRLYSVATGADSGGLSAVELPATPLAQGVMDQRFKKPDNTWAQNAALAVDTTTSRLFLPFTKSIGGTPAPKPSRYLVVHDAAPPYAPPATESVDANTNGGPEVPGVTTATYSASATGFGSRYRQVGGTAALIANTAGTQGISQGVRPGTRELRFAAVRRLTLGNDESAAEAAGGYVDHENTRADLNETQLRDPEGNPVNQPGSDADNPRPVPPLVDWPWPPAVCADFGGSGKESDSRGARVSCRAALPAVGAYAVQDRTDAASVVVGRSEFRVDATVDGLRGTITTATATAKDIDVLGGLLRIQEVSAKAVASAHGQPGTTATSYARTVKEVTLGGQPLCGDGADTKRCDIRAVEREVNTRLAHRVRIHFPSPEETRSKGGYQAAVQRRFGEQLQEIAINGQAPDELDVPAVVITVFTDNSQPGRTMVDLASVAVEARYGITGGDGDVGGVGGVGGLDGGGSSGAVGAIADGTSPLFGVSPGAASTLSGLARPDTRLRPATGIFEGGRRLAFLGLAGFLEVLPGWVLLLVPVYLAARRWLLLERATLLAGGRA